MGDVVGLDSLPRRRRRRPGNVLFAFAERRNGSPRTLRYGGGVKGEEDCVNS